LVSINKESANLYRFEYYEPLDEFTYVDWVWLEPIEVSEYRSSAANVKYRKATAEEEELYNEAYADGYGIAALMEFQSNDNGITFRVQLNEDKQDFTHTKMFKCATCGEHRDFETEVAMVNGFYLTALKGEDNDILWHVCYDCAMLELEVDWIDFDNTEES